jgi:nucleoside-diphosphate-sugar epimerase
MKRVVIFGGAGYIGTHLARYLLQTHGAEEVVVADIKDSPLASTQGIRFVRTDVRQAIPATLVSAPPDWIFNFAAVHREPGHLPFEYFDTNLNGAQHVCDFATTVKCSNLCFTSSISVYGPTLGPTDEQAPICPTTPYGASKYPAELIHERWLEGNAARRLIIIRPGVVYGPGNPGNIGRMVQAIQKGYFAFPGSTKMHKSYAYIYGLLESISFVIARGERLVRYNYVETPTETFGDIATHVKQFVGSKAPILNLPAAMLMPVAKTIQVVLGDSNPIHPVRVRKAAMQTNIVPQALIDMGFKFQYPFAESLRHWRSQKPEDFSHLQSN